MLDIYAYEYIRSTIDERREKALVRYERMFRRPDEGRARPPIEGDVVELTFADGCPSTDQLTA